MSYSPGSRYAPCVERDDGPATRAMKYRSAKRRDHREAMRDAMAELLLIEDEGEEIEELDTFDDDFDYRDDSDWREDEDEYAWRESERYEVYDDDSFDWDDC